MLAVAIIAIGAVAIIGVAYAYTASTDNTGNTSGSEYITLSQGNTVGDYTGAFDVTVKYDTVTAVTGEPATVTTTYTLAAGQTSEIITGVNAVCLGEKTITVNATNGANYIFSVGQKTTNGMSGTFYIGITADAGENIRAFTTTTGTANYYKTGNDHETVTVKANASPIPKATGSIVVKLYYVPTTYDVQPLTNVTFEFKAEVVTA